MKKYNDKELQIIFDNITDGVVYVGIKDKQNKGFISYSMGYIFYTNYGQTATKKVLKHFENTLRIMFSDCDEIEKTIDFMYQLDKIGLSDNSMCESLKVSYYYCVNAIIEYLENGVY